MFVATSSRDSQNQTIQSNIFFHGRAHDGLLCHFGFSHHFLFRSDHTKERIGSILIPSTTKAQSRIMAHLAISLLFANAGFFGSSSMHFQPLPQKGGEKIRDNVRHGLADHQSRSVEVRIATESHFGSHSFCTTQKCLSNRFIRTGEHERTFLLVDVLSRNVKKGGHVNTT